MANITAASILYSTSYVTKIGGVLLTATNVETVSTATEYVTGGVELLPAKLGLTDEGIAGVQLVAGELPTSGTTLAGSGLPGLIWCDPWMVDSASANEAQKELKAAGNFCAQVTMVGKVPYLRLLAITTAGQDKGFSELKVKTAVSACATTVYCMGR